MVTVLLSGAQSDIVSRGSTLLQHAYNLTYAYFWDRPNPSSSPGTMVISNLRIPATPHRIWRLMAFQPSLKSSRNLDTEFERQHQPYVLKGTASYQKQEDDDGLLTMSQSSYCVLV